MPGFIASGTDLDDLFDPLGGLTARANTNFLNSAGTDISGVYAQVSSSETGTRLPTTNFLSGASDLGSLYSPRYTTLYPGRYFTWGRNIEGQLGNNTSGATASTPVQTVSGGTNWLKAAGSTASNYGIKTDGTLWSWGQNSQGPLGDNTVTLRSSPVQTVSGGTNWWKVNGNISAQLVVALKTDGTYWTWGSAANGGLGDNQSATNRSSPVQTVSGGTNWLQCSSGFQGSGGLKTDGTLWMWGRNNAGQLGNNTTTNTSSPVQTVSGGTNWAQIACGVYFTAGIKTDGTLWLWGVNGVSGCIGDNTTTNRSSPVQTVAGGTNWRQLTLGAENVTAVKNDGTLWVWGNNSDGNLGDGTTTNRSSPVQSFAGGTNWLRGYRAHGTGGAVKTDGTLWMWGANAGGQLADGTTVAKSSPVQTTLGGATWYIFSGAAGTKNAIRT